MTTNNRGQATRFNKYYKEINDLYDTAIKAGSVEQLKAIRQQAFNLALMVKKITANNEYQKKDKQHFEEVAEMVMTECINGIADIDNGSQSYQAVVGYDDYGETKTAKKWATDGIVWATVDNNQELVKRLSYLSSCGDFGKCLRLIEDEYGIEFLEA